MPLSPTKRSRRSDTPFTKEQEIWLVKRSAFMGPTELRRAFIREFLNPRNEHQNAPGRDTFRRLIKRFDDSGGVTGRRMENEALITVSTPESIARVERYGKWTQKSPKCLRRFGNADFDDLANSEETFEVEAVSSRQGQPTHGEKQRRSPSFLSLVFESRGRLRTKSNLERWEVVPSPSGAE